MRFIYILFLTFFVVSAQAEVATNYNESTIFINSHKFNAEVAKTDWEQLRGMQFRKSIQDNEAMIFPYQTSSRRSFWMKDTLISLDILYFDSKGILQEVFNNVPPCKEKKCPLYISKSHDIRYVVELRGGLANQLAIELGARLYSSGF